MKVDAVTKRWIQCERDELAVRDGCYFDERAADHIMKFIRQLRHFKGRWAGEPIEPLEWQREQVIMPLFGWMNRRKLRRYRIAYIEIPKKNGKSSMCGWFAGYLAAGDAEPAAEVYCAANDRNQAGIVYKEASTLIQKCPLLEGYYSARDSRKEIEFPSLNSFIRAMSRDAYSAEGLNIHGLIFDELHAQKKRDLWDALRYGGAARAQPLLIAITTAGYDRTSICWEVRKRAKKVLDGDVVDHTFFPFIACAEEDDDWTKPAVWEKANPSFGVTINPDDFAQECKEAQETPSLENSFKRYRLNIWTKQESKWLDLNRWDECDKPTPLEELRGKRCYLGVDLGESDDMSALAACFPWENDSYAFLTWFWAPEWRAQEKEMRENIPYMRWAEEGHLNLVKRKRMSWKQPISKILELAELHRIEEIVYDPFQAAALAAELDEQGFELVKFHQTCRHYNEPSREFEKLIIENRIIHGGHPVLRWHVENVCALEDRDENIKPVKAEGGEKIDGVVACVMALARAMIARSGVSVYTRQERGFVEL